MMRHHQIIISLTRFFRVVTYDLLFRRTNTKTSVLQSGTGRTKRGILQIPQKHGRHVVWIP